MVRLLTDQPNARAVLLSNACLVIPHPVQIHISDGLSLETEIALGNQVRRIDLQERQPALLFPSGEIFFLPCLIQSRVLQWTAYISSR